MDPKGQGIGGVDFDNCNTLHYDGGCNNATHYT